MLTLNLRMCKNWRERRTRRREKICHWRKRLSICYSARSTEGTQGGVSA